MRALVILIPALAALGGCAPLIGVLTAPESVAAGIAGSVADRGLRSVVGSLDEAADVAGTVSDLDRIMKAHPDQAGRLGALRERLAAAPVGQRRREAREDPLPDPHDRRAEQRVRRRAQQLVVAEPAEAGAVPEPHAQSEPFAVIRAESLPAEAERNYLTELEVRRLADPLPGAADGRRGP